MSCGSVGSPVLRRVSLASALAVALLVAPIAAGDPAAERRRAIDAGIAEIERELLRDGGGDWEAWFRSVEPFRSSLRERIRLAASRVPAPVDPARRATILEAPGIPPLFEWEPETQIWYLFEPGESLGKFAAERKFPGIAAEVSKWLAARGIDLVVVTVPKMSEVYPERVATGVPPDRIVAPQMRRFLLDLLKADVEAIDLLPAFLAHSESRPEPLYLPADTHWQDEGKELAVKAIAERLSRYDFVKEARTAPSLFRVEEARLCVEGAFWGALDSDQQRRARPFLEVRSLATTPVDGRPVPTLGAPILVMGDSYARFVPDLLAGELNLPVADLAAANQMADALGEFVRDPTLLEGTRVIVWLHVATSQVVFGGTLPPLPPLRRSEGGSRKTLHDSGAGGPIRPPPERPGPA